MKLITILFTLLLTSFVRWNFVDARHINRDPTQKFIKINGEKMSLSIYGNYGKKIKQTIVFMSGLNILSPIMTYKPLAEALSDEFKIIIIEPFGHGYSDVSKKPRTIENITKELHKAVHKLGLKKFYLAGHSIGGLYALNYIIQYPKEVKGFIGLDNSAQNGQDSLIGYDSLIAEKLECNRMYNNNTWSGDSEIAKVTKKKIIDKLMSHTEYYEYSEEDRQIYTTLFENSYCNDNIASEYENSPRNYEVVKDVKFPKSVPTLQILSSDTCNSYSDWLEIHQDRIYKSPYNEIVIMEAGHDIMFDKKEAIAKKVKSWVKSLKNKK
ncbi:alpha/beta-hydrolase [Neocallimastix californiae]|uniref:Alpha/beta-hydrolase n=1 Tax=Neocallimastix californiae TaxID=1754190 RepID=A0A1Y2D4K2_9FUNG|nr:alpha/beta-hydrolase [Neocallimastix californiae]|eukprot:ORY54203.1 alpha/beta-hydrolase [Neocallimastix californiae]